MFSRFSKPSKGLGVGMSALLAAGGLIYAASQSVFTG